MVKNLLADAENVRDASSIPGSGRLPGEGNGSYSSIPAWKILWTEELGGLIHGVTRVKHDLATKPHLFTYFILSIL